jgi:hypothetical protein
MEVIGKIYKVGEVQELGSNGFRKRELVVETTEEYPQKICIDFVQDNTSLIDSYKEGDNVNVAINLRGKEWIKDGVTKFFNSIQGWRIKYHEELKSADQMPQREEAPADDLPF